jgi:outer membrane immunogenic protein
VLALAGSAQAADLYVKAPAPAAYDWSGIYVGANAGYGWGNANWIVSDPTSSFLYFFSPSGAPGIFSTQPAGALAGGQIGINRQIGHYVFGVEVTGDWSGLKQSLTGPFGPAYFDDVWTTKLNDLETLTGRFGYAVDNWLFYGKAGGATGVVSVSAVSGPSAFPPEAGTFSQSARLWGITAGGGIEWGLTPNIVLGVEYDFTRLFPRQSNGFAHSPGFTPAGIDTPIGLGARTPFDVQAITGRVSYKF